MSLILGLDLSTQSLSAVVLDSTKGVIVTSDSVNFGEELPHYGQVHGFDDSGEGGEVHANPLMWLEALDLLLERMKEGGCSFSEISAVSGSGQQHGSVYLRKCFAQQLARLSPRHDLKNQLASCLARDSSPIWMDSSTLAECAEITEAVGGSEQVCAKSGSIAIERFTGPQIRKFAKNEPEAYHQTGTIHLVSSFFASIMAGKSLAIDHGDAAGMNLMNLSTKDWDLELVEATAEQLMEKLPPCVSSTTQSGPISSYFVEKYGFSPTCETVLWSGDNPCSLVGMGAASPGKLVISLGTSDTLFAALPELKTNPSAYGHVFGNPIEGYMSLICFKNGSLAREAVKEQFGLSWSDFESRALSRSVIGNDGLLMLPFYEPEITPKLDLGGALFSEDGDHGAQRTVRAVLEGQFLNMRVHSDWLGVDLKEIYLTGGASENDGIAQVLANVFGLPVERLEVPGSAVIGAALRAAHALGENLSDLEEKFCKTKAGGRIEPENAAKAVYDRMVEPFRLFLAEQ